MSGPFTTLISTSELADHLADNRFVVVDCRASLADFEWGAREYAAQHIPGAVYAHLEHDLSGPKTGSNGRHPLPEPDVLARTLGRLGIASDRQVVAYDQDVGMFASRLWWLLRWLGHDAVAVLDGGFKKWMAEGRPTSSGIETHPARDLVARLRPDMLVTADDVRTRLHVPDWRLIDARAPERYRGEVETVDRVAGHIPGATNYPFQTNVDEDGTFRPAPELRARVRGALGPTPPDRAMFYCGSGVTACHDLLALEHVGLRGAKLYAGSWSEWSADPSRPVEKG